MYFIFKIRYYFIYVLVLLSLSLFSLISSCSSTQESSDFAHISNLSSLVRSINAEKYHKQSHHCENIKIAVLDNGTSNISEHLGKTLPYDVVYDKEDENLDTTDKHGIVLLETIYAICTGSQTYDSSIPSPKLYIYNTTGLSQLDRAIDKVIAEKIDIVVYAQTWEFGGNLDGTGFINEKINKAISNGIIWLNSIGNYRNKSYYSSINFLDSSAHHMFNKYNSNHNRYNEYDRRFNHNIDTSSYTSVRLPYDNDKLLFKVSADDTPVKITLAWSRFTNNILEGTDTDLDLFLEDMSGRNISISNNVQVRSNHSPIPSYAQSNQIPSLFPKEKIDVTLNQGTYVLKVKTKTPHLFNSSDKLWFAISSTSDVSFINIDHRNSSLIFIPADNPQVITVSSSDCHCESQSSQALKRSGINFQKPEMVFPSLVKYSDDNSYIGSSTATAVAAASIALHFSSIQKHPTKEEALNFSKNIKFKLH